MSTRQYLAASLASVLLVSPAFALKRTDLIPEKSTGFVRVSHVDEGLKALGKSALGKLWADRAFQDFLGHPLKDKEWQAFVLGIEDDDEMGQIYLDQFKMLHGEYILAYENDFDSPYTIMAYDREDFLRSLEQDKVLAEYEEFEIRKDEFQGVEVIQHLFGRDTEWEFSYWQAQLNNTLVMGPSKEWVERSIMKLKKEAVEEPQGAPRVNANLSIPQIMSQWLGTDCYEDESEDKETRTLLEALGFSSTDRVAASLELNDREILLDGTISTRTLNKGIYTLFDTRPVTLPAADFIPENFALLEVGRINLPGLWKESKRIIETNFPEASPQLDMMLAMVRQQAGVDFELDLLAHLGTEFICYSVVENEQPYDVFAFELKDSVAFKRGLETVLGAPVVQPQVDMMFETVNFLDHTLYVTKDTEPGESFAFTILENYLILGQAEGVRQALRTNGRESDTAFRLEKLPIVREMHRMVPSTAFRITMVDTRKLISFAVQQLLKEEVVESVLETLEYEIPACTPDFSKLPSAEHLGSFFKPIYSYGEKTESGLHIRAVMEN